MEEEESTYTDNQCQCYSAEECDQLPPPETSPSTTLIVTSTVKPAMSSIQSTVTMSTTQSTTKSTTVTMSTTQSTTRTTTQKTAQSTTISATQSTTQLTTQSTTASTTVRSTVGSSVMSASRVVVLTEPESYLSDEYVTPSTGCKEIYETLGYWSQDCRTRHPTSLQFDRILSIPGEYTMEDSDKPVVEGFKLPKYFKMEFDVWFDNEV